MNKQVEQEFVIENDRLLEYKGKGGWITIPEGVRFIKDGAFSALREHFSVKIPNSMTYIGRDLFAGNDWLREILIPQSVTSIDRQAFLLCSSDLIIYAYPHSYAEKYAIKYEIAVMPLEPNGEILERPPMGEFDIRYNKLHHYNGNASDVVVPNGVTHILDFSFANCESIVNVILPHGVKEIYMCAFHGCKNLESVTIPPTVTLIGGYAFERCPKLTKITIPDSVINIRGDIFSDPRKVTIYTPAGSKAEDYARKVGCPVVTAGVASSLTGFTLNDHPNYVIKNGVFEKYIDTENKKIVLLHGVPFGNCIKQVVWADVVIPKGVKEIGKFAFYRQFCIRSVVIPEGVTRIGEVAFSDCFFMERITIPKSVTEIGYAAFRHVPSLKTIDYLRIELLPTELKLFAIRGFLERYARGEADQEYIDVYLPYIKRRCKKLLESDKDFEPLYRFLIDYKLISWDLLEKLLSASPGDEIDVLLRHYQSIEFTPDVAEKLKKQEEEKKACLLAGGALTVTEAKKNWSFKKNENGDYCITRYKGEEADVIVPDRIHKGTVVTIGEQAFCRCEHMTSVTIPASITGIYHSAFKDCTGLKRVYIQDLARWCEIDFKSWDSNPLNSAKELYLNGKLVTNLVIPEGVTGINDSAFSGNNGLVSVTLPKTLTSIGTFAFSSQLMKEIIIPDSVTSIGSCAFHFCQELVSVSIPRGMTRINEGTFEWCSNLTSVTIPESVSVIGETAFRYCEKLTIYTVSGSCAERFALRHGIPVVTVSE